MKAIEEVGIEKAVRFAAGEIQKALLKIAWLPPIRKALLQLYGCRIGKETVVLNVDFVNLYRTGFRGLRIGNNCFIGDGCLFDLADRIEIGPNTTLAQRVVINTHLNVGFNQHPLQKKFPAFSKPVSIEENCFVGIGSIILAGTVIRSNSFVGAASMVNKEVPPNSVVGGVPAKPLREK